MNREEMIRRLVTFSVEAALREPQSYWLQEMFEKGFAGYRKFSDSRLKRELELRGLDAVDDEYDADEAEELTEQVSEEAFTAYATRGREAD